MNVNLATRKECLNTEYVNNHTTLSAALDVTLDNLIVLQSLVDILPALLETSFFMRENELTTLVFLALYINLNLVTRLEIWVVTEFRSRDNTIALVADVNNYFLLVS